MVALTPEVVAGAVLFLLAVLGELHTKFTRKRVNYLRRKQRTAMDAHAAIPDLVETVERVEDKVDGVDDKVTTTQKTIAYLHREELPDDPLARERLDVEADDDFFNGGD